jgi:hypothetical protein
VTALGQELRQARRRFGDRAGRGKADDVKSLALGLGDYVVLQPGSFRRVQKSRLA